MSFVLSDYLCPACGLFESLETRPAPELLPCPACALPSDRCISAVKSMTVWGSVTTGKVEPPPSPLAMDTSKIGDGMRTTEWRKRRQKMWRDHDRKRRKDMYG